MLPCGKFHSHTNPEEPRNLVSGPLFTSLKERDPLTIVTRVVKNNLEDCSNGVARDREVMTSLSQYCALRY